MFCRKNDKSYKNDDILYREDKIKVTYQLYIEI